MRTTTIALATLCALAALPALAGPVKTSMTASGPVFTDERGMTLYTLDRESDGKIACVGVCAGNWPPLLAGTSDKADGAFSFVQRPDGAMQWAYKGKPLYLWSRDSHPGEMTGDGMKGSWHVAKP